jgi:hypothetical protein
MAHLIFNIDKLHSDQQPLTVQAGGDLHEYDFQD